MPTPRRRARAERAARRARASLGTVAAAVRRAGRGVRRRLEVLGVALGGVALGKLQPRRCSLLHLPDADALADRAHAAVAGRESHAVAVVVVVVLVAVEQDE